MHLSDPQSAAGKEPGVTISTIHAAKGLEWDVVFVMRQNVFFHPLPWWPSAEDSRRLSTHIERNNDKFSYEVLAKCEGEQRIGKPRSQVMDTSTVIHSGLKPSNSDATVSFLEKVQCFHSPIRNIYILYVPLKMTP